MKLLGRFLREPLVHFVAIGVLIFALYAALDDTSEVPGNVIVVSPERIDQLARAFESVWTRPPNEDEIDALIDEYVHEEIYYREALILGLDRDDVVIRRRMRQKMEFLTDSGADLMQPAEGELEAYLAANEQNFRRLPLVAFEQVYLGEDPATERVEQSLSLLRSEPATNLTDLAERTLLPAKVSLSHPQTVDDAFGQGFFERLAQLPVGAWSAPVASTYGVHLVRIVERQAERMPRLDEVRDAVMRDWRGEKTLEIREAHFARLRENFVVDIRRADDTGPQDR